MALLLAAACIIVILAIAIALAPYIFGLLGIALLIVVVVLVAGLVLVALGSVEQRFAKWFDNTRLANWQVSSEARADAKRQARWDRLAERETRDRQSSVGRHP